MKKTSWKIGTCCSQHIVNEKMKVIADVEGSESDARLIAAAPELLDALKELSNAVSALREGKRDGGTFGRVSMADDLAKQAIAKAEGKEVL